jgi:hypothetical protein
MKNPQTAAAKWSRNLGNAGQSITDGVNSVQVNPAQQAAAQKDLAKQKFAAAIDSGKWEAGLARTTLQGWQQAMIKKGVPRVSEGASQAQPKVAAFLGQLIPAVEGAVASLPPRGSPAQNDQRMIMFAAKMRQFKRQS